MTVKVTKPALNLREELSSLKKPSGVAGEAMLRAETPQEQFNLIGAGRKNLIINGAIQVSQRGDYSSATASSHNTYTVDRWKTTTVGVNATVQKQSVTLPNGFEVESTKIVASSTASSGAYIGQNQTIEDGQRILRSGGSWTVSAWIKTNRNDVIVRLGGVKNIGEPAVGDGQWHYYSATFEYTTSGTGDQGIGFLTYDGGSTAITSGDYIEFTQFQLELGSVATPFEHRSYGEELALCQRYYQKSYYFSEYAGNNTSLGCISFYGSDVLGIQHHYLFPVPMRTAPAITIYRKNGGATLNLQRSDNSSSYITVTAQDFSDTGFSLKNTSTGSSGYTYRGHYLADAEL